MPPSLEEMLGQLSKAGIELGPGITFSQIAERCEGYEGDYERILGVLGGNHPEAHWPIAPRIWHCDTECIYGDGAYIEIARRMRLLAGGALPIENMRDRVSDDGAWLAITLHGREHRWDLEVNDDWVDLHVFAHFARLLDARSTDVHYTYHDLGGQDFLAGCATEEQRQELNRLPGLHFLWMNESSMRI